MWGLIMLRRMSEIYSFTAEQNNGSHTRGYA